MVSRGLPCSKQCLPCSGCPRHLSRFPRRMLLLNVHLGMGWEEVAAVSLWYRPLLLLTSSADPFRGLLLVFSSRAANVTGNPDWKMRLPWSRSLCAKKDGGQQAGIPGHAYSRLLYLESMTLCSPFDISLCKPHIRMIIGSSLPATAALALAADVQFVMVKIFSMFYPHNRTAGCLSRNNWMGI